MINVIWEFDFPMPVIMSLKYSNCKIPLLSQLKTSRNGLEVAKAWPKSEGRMGMMADSYDSERLRGGHVAL